jgi:hypothetical protein
MLKNLSQLFSATNTQPRRSPRNHQQTAALGLARKVDGKQDFWRGKKWAYHQQGKFYKRAASGYLILATGYNFDSQVSASSP